jgi:UTP--glucose-1-phosphate uridylyltransferase
VLLPDVLVAQAGVASDLQAMTERFVATGKAQVMVEPVPWEQVHQYGVVDLGGAQLHQGKQALMQQVVEKPAREAAPSNLAIVGRYVLPGEIFELLAATKPGAGGEIQLTDAIAALMQQTGAEAYRMRGRSFDCGSKLGYLEATLAYGLEHPVLGQDFKGLLARYAQ